MVLRSFWRESVKYLYRRHVIFTSSFTGSYISSTVSNYNAAVVGKAFHYRNAINIKY